jgi:predicted HicB family RNase H-like nuclease
MEMFTHKGYNGSIETSVEDNVLHGKVLCINDLVTYEAETLQGLKDEFIIAVEDYLVTCKHAQKSPDKPFNGVFNVRTNSELHKKAHLRAMKDDVTLNSVVVAALDQYLSKQEIHHHHNHKISVSFEQTAVFATGSETDIRYVDLNHESTNEVRH